MSSQQAMLDAAIAAQQPDDNPHVVENPEAVRWRDYHEFVRIQREQEARL